MLRQRLMLADAGAVALGFMFAFVVQELFRPVPMHIRTTHVRLVILSLPLWYMAFSFGKLFTSRATARPAEEARRIITAAAFGIGGLVAMSFVAQYKELSRLWVMAAFFGVTATMLIERRIARVMFARLRRAGRMSRRIVIVGTDVNAIGLLHSFQRRPELGYEVVGFVGDDDLGERGGVTVLGTFDDTERVLQETDAIGVMVSLSSVSSDTVNSMARRLTDSGYHVALSSSLHDLDVTRFRPQDVAGRTMLYVEPVIRGGWRGVAKRAFDVTTSAAGLLATSPLLLVAAIAIKLDSRGPVFFRQERVGREGVTFPIIKLRTMCVDAEARKAELADSNESDGPLFKMRADPRVTRVGRVLRKLSIDELPQLWNVLRGDMSVVGPRPALPSEMSEWTPDVHERLRVMPGITGMWQVSGRSDTNFDEYKRLDLYYVDNWSLAHDLRIVVKTFGVVVRGRGAA